ncbi:MAG: chemotaxis protein CheX [Pseudomonadales bacterium]|nr:chemotaxis protein CheX [Pseudomonadales bacterium]
MIKFDNTLVSKLLVFEDDKEIQLSIKEVLERNGLVAVRQQSYSAMKVLYSNIDLGGVLLGETSHDSAEGIHDGFELAVRIHKIRPELPIFLRREQDTVDDLTEEQQAAIAGVYTLDNPDKLLEIIERFVADTEYPISLIRRIEEVTLSSLESTFKNTTVKMALPYLVKDKLSYGDITSLLPVQAPWFNGYMMFQSEEEPMLGLIDADKTSMESQNADFRVVMGLLSEISNMAWGGLKTRLLSLHPPNYEERHTIAVPITVNQYKEYISFGTDRTQLCFEYTLYDNDHKLDPVKLYQKFIFNIKWNPEEYREADENTVEELVESGELELF